MTTSLRFSTRTSTPLDTADVRAVTVVDDRCVAVVKPGEGASMRIVLPFSRRRRRPVSVAAATPTPADRRIALMRSVATGDQAAFAELYDELAPIVFGVVLRVIRDRAQAEEITQEVFVELWRIAPRYDETKASVSTWASTLAHRRAVDVVRSSESRRAREEHDGRRAEADHDGVVEAVLDRDDRRAVIAALHVLTDTQRRAVELAFYEGLTQAEVARRLDIPLGTAKTRLRDGLIRLRDELGVER